MVQKLQTIQEHDEQESDSRQRTLSSVAFPYGDLKDAIMVAKTICDRAGYSACTRDQLSAWLGHGTSTSGTFRMRVSAARLFGLVDIAPDSVKLTKLGRDILDPSKDRSTRIQAFLHVPLYSQLFERYKSYPLPGDVGIEQEMVSLGVAPKQKAKARQAFQRSAEQAGFFNEIPGRLVLPSEIVSINDDSATREKTTIPLHPSQAPVPSLPQYDHGAGGGGGNSSGIQALQEHPLIHNLYVLAPPVGTKWSKAKREAWLALQATVVHSLYSDDE